MGQSFEKETNKGNIKITLDKSHIVSGEDIRGTLELTINQPINTNSVQVYFRGRQIVTLGKVDYNNQIKNPNTSNQDTFNSNKVPQYISTKRQTKYLGNKSLQIIQDSEQIIELQQTLVSQNGQQFTSGTHRLNFQFHTPNNMPNTFVFNNVVAEEKLKSSIEYEIAAGLQIPGTNQMIIGQQEVLVKSAFPYHQLQQLSQPNEKEYKESFELTAKIDQQVAMSGDVIPARMIIDNQKNTSDIKLYKWKLVQYLSLKTKNGEFKENIRKRISKTHFEKVGAGEFKSKAFDCVINTNHKDTPFPVTVKTNLIQNTYKLEFMAVTKKLLVFNKEHTIEFELDVFERQQPINQQGQYPPGYQQNNSTQNSQQNQFNYPPGYQPNNYQQDNNHNQYPPGYSNQHYSQDHQNNQYPQQNHQNNWQNQYPPGYQQNNNQGNYQHYQSQNSYPPGYQSYENQQQGSNQQNQNNQYPNYQQINQNSQNQNQNSQEKKPDYQNFQVIRRDEKDQIEKKEHEVDYPDMNEMSNMYKPNISGQLI